MSGIIVFVLWTILFTQLMFKFTKIEAKTGKLEPVIFLLIIYITGTMIGLSLFLLSNYEYDFMFFSFFEI